MPDPYASKLAQDWISTFSNGGTIGPDEGNPFQAFDAIVRGDPLYAWDLILEVVRLDPAKRSWDVLAAGPLEDLLSRHGATIIDYIAAYVEQDEALRELLQGVRQFDTPDAVWERVKALRGER
jgi:hypothetical protein